MRVLLIGERPPLGASLGDHSPLYPLPRGCAGQRLQELTGLSMLKYLSCFDRVNLVAHPWPDWNVRTARWAAVSLVRGGLLRDRHVVLLGARVRAAFRGLLFLGHVERELATWYFHPRYHCHWGILPHPSGRSRVWNAPGMRERARVFLGEAVR